MHGRGHAGAWVAVFGPTREWFMARQYLLGNEAIAHAALEGGVGFVAGLACLVAGMETHWSISVVGFVLMLISTIVAITSWRHVDFERAERPQGPKVRSSPDNPFMDKLEERWRRRHGDDI